MALLLWRGPEPLSHETPQPPRQEVLSGKLSESVTGSLPPHSSKSAAAVGSSEPALEQVRDTPDANEAPSAPRTPDRFASLEGGSAHTSLHQGTQLANAQLADAQLANACVATPSSPETPPHAKRAQHGQQPGGRHAFAELSKSRAARREAGDGRVPTLELPADCATHPGAFSAFGSPVETTRTTSPVSPQLTPASTFGSPVDLPDSFTAGRQSDGQLDGQRQPRTSPPHIQEQDSDAGKATGAATGKRHPDSRQTAAEGSERRTAHREARCQPGGQPGGQPGNQSFENASSDPQERSQHAERDVGHPCSRQPCSAIGDQQVRYGTVRYSSLRFSHVPSSRSWLPLV